MNQIIANSINIKKKILPLLKLEYLIIGCFVLVATFYIYDHIGLRAFWSDEAGVANIIDNSFMNLWQRAIIDGHPIFYLYLLKTWSIIFGNSEIILRSFSALFAIAMIITVYFFAEKVFLSRKTGIIAAGLATTNYFLIWFATQNKVYTFSAFIGLVSYYLFTRLILEKTSKATLISYIVFTTIAIYTHPWQILSFGSQLLSYLLLFKHAENRKNILIAVIIIGLLMIPALLIYYSQGQLGASSWITKISFSMLITSIGYLAYGSNVIYLFLSLIAIPTTINAYKGMSLVEKRREQAIITILGGYLLVPLSCAFLISQFKPMYVIGRYEMIVLPAFIMIVARLWSFIKQEWFFFTAGFALVIMTTREVMNDRYVVNSYKSTDKTVAQDIINTTSNRDTIIATDLSYATFKYYFGKSDHQKGVHYEYLAFPKEMEDHPGWINVQKMVDGKAKYEKEAVELVNNINTNGSNSVWVLYRENELNGILRDQLKKRYPKEEIILIPSPRMPSWFDYLILYQK